MSRWIPFALVSIVGCVPAATTTPGTSAVAAPISVDELRRDLSVFAADSFRGRETGMGDELRAARFIANRLAALGVTPAGDSGYFQRVPLTSVGLSPASRVVVSAGGAPVSLAIGADVVPLTSLGTGAQNPRLSADADIVFASYGIVDANLNRDDYAGLDIANKAVVVVNDAPPGASPAAVTRYTGQSGIQQRLSRLIGSPTRPAAIILVLTGTSGDELFYQAGPSLIRAVTALDTTAPVPDAERLFPVVMLARVAPGGPWLPSDWPTNDKARALAGRRLTTNLQILKQQITSYNVAGIVRGGSRANTYVAYGAHLDHVGVGEAVNGDSIYNGADDDGSGSMALLAIARTYAQGPRPARSQLFVWHTGEEKGLLGAQWFTDHPTVPIDSIVAQINADMIGRNHTDSIYIVGPSAAPQGQSRVLGTIVDSVNAALPRPFAFNREWDSPTHPERIYYRSDHYMYAQKRIPVVFFTSGLHEDYHKPSDEVHKIDFDKLRRAADLMRLVGWAVSERDSRPR